MGNASSLPGRVALKISPNILDDYQKQLKNYEARFNSIITGTNGKTTTTGILRSIYKEYLKSEIISNEFGANLYYGICSELIRSSNIVGQLKFLNYALEVDEATLPNICKTLKANSMIVTNVFRDQLDRFGELNTTLNFIAEGIEKSLDSNPHPGLRLVLNYDDPRVRELNKFDNQTEIYWFSVRRNGKPIEISDFDSSESEARNFKPRNLIQADIIEEKESSTRFAVNFGRVQEIFDIKLPGVYNVYNAVAAIANAYALDVQISVIERGLQNYQTNFGRAENKLVNEHELKIFLIKNPTGCSEVLKHLSNNPGASYLVIINDNYADGRDVSWLWDAEFEHIDNAASIVCAGNRAYDIALRFKYAGVPEEKISIMPSISEAISLTTKSPGTTYVLPTYTALLELEKIT